MITHTKQSWTVGNKVNVGFLKNLTVISCEAIKDGMPDVYTLRSDNGTLYQFTPHNGIERI